MPEEQLYLKLKFRHLEEVICYKVVEATTSDMDKVRDKVVRLISSKAVTCKQGPSFNVSSDRYDRPGDYEIWNWAYVTDAAITVDTRVVRNPIELPLEVLMSW